MSRTCLECHYLVFRNRRRRWNSHLSTGLFYIRTDFGSTLNPDVRVLIDQGKVCSMFELQNGTKSTQELWMVERWQKSL